MHSALGRGPGLSRPEVSAKSSAPKREIPPELDHFALPSLTHVPSHSQHVRQLFQDSGTQIADRVYPVAPGSLPGHGLDYDSREQQRSEEHTSELQSRPHLVCRLLLEKKKKTQTHTTRH